MEKSPYSVALGNRIKEIRTAKGITQAEFSARINKDFTSISKLESGKFNPTLSYLIEIAKGLEIDLVQLLEGIDAVE